MAQYSNLKAYIEEKIYENGTQAITGDILQDVLKVMTDDLGEFYQTGGVASPSTDPGTPDAKVIYFATEAGTYTNFGGITLAAGEVALLIFETRWTKVELNVLSSANGGVKTANLADGAVTTEKIAGGAVETAKIANSAVTSGKVADGAIGTAKIADGAIDADKIAANAVESAKIKNGAVTEGKINDGAVTAGKVAANAVTTAKIADDAVTTAKLNDGAVTEDKIATDAVTSGKVKDGAIGTAKIAAGAVTHAKIGAGAVEESNIKDGAVTSDKIANGAVGSDQLAEGAFSAENLADGSVTTDKLADEAVTAEKIADGAVTAGKFANGSVTTIKLGSGAVTTEKIGDGMVTRQKLADSSVSTSKIIDGAVTTDKVADGAITDAKLENPVSVSQNISTGKEELSIGGVVKWILDNVPELESDNLVKSGGVAARLINIKYFAINLGYAISQGAVVGDIYYNTDSKVICLIKTIATVSVIPYQDGAIYTHNGALYVYNGTELIGIKMEGSYTNPNDVKSDGWYVIKDRGEGYGSAALLVQKNGNTIVQLQFVIGVSVLQPSIQYRLSTDNGTTWGSWIDWVENAYSPYAPKTRTIYKFLKALGDTPIGEYYYNVNTLKVYQNNSGSAVEVTPREQDRYIYEGKQYIYRSDAGLIPLEDDILTISGYHPTTSSFAKNGTYYVVGNNLLYVVQAGVNTVVIPWEKGRKYQFDGALYYYNGTRLVRYDNTGVTISNPASARCVSDSFIGKASCGSRVAITADGIAYVVYMCGSNSWYEANTKVVLSEFPINRPEMAKNYVVAEYTDAGISGYLALPNVHLLQNGNVRVLFSNYQSTKELMGVFYKDFNVENKTFGVLNQIMYNGSPMTFEVLESIVGTELETSDGIHISGNLMNDFGVDGSGNAIKYFFINAADGNPVVFSTIDDFASVQLVKVLPITDRQYESALCKLGGTFYIYYRAMSGSWLMTTADWDTFTTPFQFSTLNNRSDIYSDGQKVYLCGANAEIDDVNKFRRTNAHILVGSGATIDGYEEVQEVHDERGLVELNYIHLGNTHIIVCSSSPIMIDKAGYDDLYRGKYGIYFIPIREARGIGLVF